MHAKFVRREVQQPIISAARSVAVDFRKVVERLTSVTCTRTHLQCLLIVFQSVEEVVAVEELEVGGAKEFSV